MRTIVKYIFKGLVYMSYLIFGMAGGLVILASLFYLAITNHWIIVSSLFFLTFLGLFSYVAYLADKEKAEKDKSN